MNYPQRFYANQLLCAGLWWLVVRACAKRWPFELCAGSVVTSPTFLVGSDDDDPGRFLRRLHRYRRAIFLAQPLALALAAWSDAYATRAVAAFAATAYHLLETSVSRRHGEYGLLYASWACLLPEELARGACLGVAVHFILSSGLGKALVGGLKWVDASTMRLYLRVYRDSSSALTRPVLPALSRLLSEHLASSVAVATLWLELVLAPWALWNCDVRSRMAPLLVAMHVGIALGMSLQVGLAFITTIPVYVAGFAENGAPLGGAALGLAFAIGLGPSLVSVFLGALPECWPCSPIWLFPLNAEQAAPLAERTMAGDTRLVLAPDGLSDVVGATVRYAMRPAARAAKASVHDAVLRTIGFTVAADHALLTLLAHPTLYHNPGALVVATEKFLSSNRLVESASGRPLRRALFVRVSGDGSTVVEVISQRLRKAG